MSKYIDIINKGTVHNLKTIYGQNYVEAERHGRWHKIDKDGKGRASLFGCSVCKSATQLAWYEKDMFYKYCPNCGAKMDEVDNENTEP